MGDLITISICHFTTCYDKFFAISTLFIHVKKELQVYNWLRIDKQRRCKHERSL